jgi:hypothetical protein
MLEYCKRKAGGSTVVAIGLMHLRRFHHMNKENCWEIKRCGRGPSGKNDCPAAKDSTLHGVHGGTNAGRACWVAAGTCGSSAATGEFAKQLKDCLRCDFYKAVEAGEKNVETGFSATRLGMLRALQNGKSADHAPASKGNGSVDANLLDEFAQVVQKMMAKENAPQE